MKKKLRTRTRTAAVAFLLSALALPGSILAPSTYSYATDGTNDAEKPTSITITSVGDPTLAPKTDLQLTVNITNPHDAPIQITDLNVHAQNWPAAHPQQVASWMSGSYPGYLLQHQSVDISVPAGQTVTQTITVPRKNITWHNSAKYWGPRGIGVEAITADNHSLNDRSYVIVTPDAKLKPAPFTAVVPIVDTAVPQAENFYRVLTDGFHDASANTSADASQKPSEDDVAATRAATITAWDLPGVTLVRDPALNDATTVQHAEQHLLPAYGADIAAFAHTNNADRASAYTQPYHSDIFLAQGTIDTQTLQAVQQSGLSAAIIPDNLLSRTETPDYTPDAHTALDINGKALPILTANSTLSQAIAGTITDHDTTINLDALDRRQTSLALSAVLYREKIDKQRGVVVVTPTENVTPQNTDIRDTLQALTAAPWNSASGVNALLTQPAAEFGYAALPESAPVPGEFTTQDLEEFDTVWAHTGSVRKIFAPSTKVDSAMESYLDKFLATQWRANPDGRSNYLKTFNLIDSGAIKVEKSSTINLISKNSALPIHVTNNYDFPVHVMVDFQAPDTRLRATKSAKVTIAPQSTQQVSIPVTAWGSGDIDVTINVKNDDGDIIGSSEDVYVRVRAGWESTGTGVIAIIIGLLFLAGVVTSIRKGRRSQPVDARLARALHQQRIAQDD